MDRTREAWERVRSQEPEAEFALGPVNAATWLRDPKHMGFMLARYKFAAKMLCRRRRILEVGCGEALGTWVLARETGAEILATDFDLTQVEYARRQVAPLGEGRIRCECLDLVAGPPPGSGYDGLVAIDVIEHLHPEDEAAFLDHLLAPLAVGAAAVIGTPNQLAEAWASPPSRAGHINLFDPDRFRDTLERRFSHVFLFSMNDEMVHTGFNRMAHYLMALCVDPR
jgi:cyclopropane fatty-acyl-phospholipid synthase-like methyltransferase